jgi:hypothetical protein
MLSRVTSNYTWEAAMRLFASWWERLPVRRLEPASRFLPLVTLVVALGHLGGRILAVARPDGFTWG